MHGGGGIFGFEAYGGERPPARPGPSMYGRAGFEPYGSELGLANVPEGRAALGLVPIEIVAQATEAQQAENLKKFLPFLAIGALLFFMAGR